MLRLSAYLPFVAAMALVVVASNVLVQFPVNGEIGGLALADILTWGAFTYPFAFLVTDLANRRYGPAAARQIVFVGFMLAVVCSIVVPPLLFKYGFIEFETAADRLVRIAVASGAAFLTAQLLDVTVFNWLRRRSWWRAPVFGSLAGSVLDTAIFFSDRLFGRLRLRRPERRLRPGNRTAAGLPAGRDGTLDVLGGGRSDGEAADRGLRADPLPADRREMGAAGTGLSHSGQGLFCLIQAKRGKCAAAIFPELRIDLARSAAWPERAAVQSGNLFTSIAPRLRP